MAGEDIGGWLAQKYAIMQQQADTAKLGMTASANLDTVRAGLMPAESKAGLGLTAAQAAMANAGARNTDESTKYLGLTARANAFNATQQGGLYGAQTVGENQMSRYIKARAAGLVNPGDTPGYNPSLLGLGTSTVPAVPAVPALPATRDLLATPQRRGPGLGLPSTNSSSSFDFLYPPRN